MTISKAWDFEISQTMQVVDKIFHVHECIRLACDLPIIELDIEAMNISYNSPTRRDTVRDFVAHMKSVMDADLSYPIILNEDGYIIDGRHRLCKALYLGEKTIKAKRFIDDDDASFEWE